MSANTAISWTDTTWNPLLGCRKVSPGCDRCYAIKTATVRAGNPHPAVKAAFAGLTHRDEDDKLDWTGRINLLPDRLDQPLSWKKPSRVFVNSQSDLFHEDVPDEFIADVFAIMSAAKQHTFQLLTKRHGRMRSLLNRRGFQTMVQNRVYNRHPYASPPVWPLPNLWLGVSAEDTRWADIRVSALLATPAALRWVSAEPLLGYVNLRPYLDYLGWVVTGGESGPGARPALTDWFRDVRDQCAEAGVAYHHKQNGVWIDDSTAKPVSVVDLEGHEWVALMRRVPVKLAGRELDGQTHDEYPLAVAS